MYNLFITETCDVPDNYTITLPSTCNVVYHTGQQVNTSIINIGRCSNQVCHTEQGQCSEDDETPCCCQSLAYRNIEYACDVGALPRVYDKIVSRCGCVYCNISVSFVGIVIDEAENPLPLAIIRIDNDLRLTVDRYGMFGFTVSGTISEVSIKAEAMSYTKYNSIISVIPGIANFIAIEMLPTESFVFGIRESLIISVMTLNQYDSVSAFILLLSNNTKGDSLVIFPTGYFLNVSTNNLRFEIVPIQLDYDDAIFAIRSDFTTPLPELKVPIVKRQADSFELIISIVAFGSIMVTNQDLTVDSDMELLIVTYIDATAYTQTEAESFSLFVYDEEMSSFIDEGLSPSVDFSNGVFVITYNASDLFLPLVYLIGRTVSPICYTVVRIFNTEGELDQPIPVIFVTRQSNVREVTLFRGLSKLCAPIPCDGELTIRIDDLFNNYRPSETHYTLRNSQINSESPIYSSLQGCVSIGIQTNDSDRFFAIFNVESIPDVPPIDSLDDLESIDVETYCYIQVQVTYCNMNNVLLSLFNSFEGHNETVSRIRILNEVNSNERQANQQGSGMDCYTSTKTCIEYVCEPISVVNISAMHCVNDDCVINAYTHCNPVFDSRQDPLFGNRGDLNVDGATNPVVVFNSTVDKPGIFFSDDSRDIAFYKCELDESVALRFECPQNIDAPV